MKKGLGRSCSASVWQGYARYGCAKQARVERDGNAYCLTHDPERVAARRAKREEKYDAHAKAAKESERVMAALVKALGCGVPYRRKWNMSGRYEHLLLTQQDAEALVKKLAK